MNQRQSEILSLSLHFPHLILWTSPHVALDIVVPPWKKCPGPAGHRQRVLTYNTSSDFLGVRMGKGDRVGVKEFQLYVYESEYARGIA